MARNIHSRLHLIGTITTQSPLHVGSYGEEVDTDLPLARNGAGELYVPGTSLAGALRALSERLFAPSVIDELWGFQDGDQGHASFVMVEDAVISNSEQVLVEIRDHVGIDREWGASAEHIKYDRAVLPRGTRLSLRLTVEVEDEEQRDQALAMLAALRQALSDGEVQLGAAKTRGLGHVKLEDAQLTEQCFSTREGILASLRPANGVCIEPAKIDIARKAHPVRKRPRLTAIIDWRPVGPVMVKAGFDGIASDMLPLVSRRDERISLVLPGSSIKGAFRCHAERIVRTLRNEVEPPWLGTEGKKKFLDAVDVRLITELFGKRGEKVETAQDDRPTWLPGLAALGVRDCYATQSVDPAKWQDIQSAQDDRALRQALNAAGLQSWTEAYHVAIDRWLGSAAESMLYTVLEPHGTEWEPLTVDIDLLRLPDTLRLPAVALLLLVIRDLANGRLPLGFATHRGMGAVKVTALRMEGRDLDGALDPLLKITLVDGKLQNVPENLTNAWQSWVNDGAMA